MITEQQRNALIEIRKFGGKHISPHMVLELVELIEELAGVEGKEPSALTEKP